MNLLVGGKKSTLQKVYFALDRPQRVCQFIVRVVLLVAIQAKLNVRNCVNVILQCYSSFIPTDFAFECSKCYIIRMVGLIIFMNVIGLNDALDLCFYSLNDSKYLICLILLLNCCRVPYC
jgi:hypothetical protein